MHAHLHAYTHTCIHTYMHTHTSVVTIVFKLFIVLLRHQTNQFVPQDIRPLVMWALFCCASRLAMEGWQKILRCCCLTLAFQEHPEDEPLLRAEGPRGPRRGQAPPAPGCPDPCPCCYYTSALKDGDERLCGWRWSSAPHPQIEGWQEGWVWWHGDAPHVPYRFRRTSSGPPPFYRAPHGLDGSGQDEEPHGPDGAAAPPPPQEPQGIMASRELV